MTACVSMLLKSRASPDMLRFSLCNKKRLAIRHMNRPLFPTTLSIPSKRRREGGRAKDLSAPPRKDSRHSNCAQLALFGYPDWGFSVLFPQLKGKCQGITHKDGARPAFTPIRQLKFYTISLSLTLSWPFWVRIPEILLIKVPPSPPIGSVVS